VYMYKYMYIDRERESGIYQKRNAAMYEFHSVQLA
jgi:hypothetical protein